MLYSHNNNVCTHCSSNTSSKTKPQLENVTPKYFSSSNLQSSPSYYFRPTLYIVRSIPLWWPIFKYRSRQNYFSLSTLSYKTTIAHKNHVRATQCRLHNTVRVRMIVRCTIDEEVAERRRGTNRYAAAGKRNRDIYWRSRCRLYEANLHLQSRA